MMQNAFPAVLHTANGDEGPLFDSSATWQRSLRHIPVPQHSLTTMPSSPQQRIDVYPHEKSHLAHRGLHCRCRNPVESYGNLGLPVRPFTPLQAKLSFLLTWNMGCSHHSGEPYRCLPQCLQVLSHGHPVVSIHRTSELAC